MALLMEFNLTQTGINLPAAYAKLTGYQRLKDVVVVNIEYFASEEARAANFNPVAANQIPLLIACSEPVIFESLYVMLKSLLEFSSSADV